MAKTNNPIEDIVSRAQKFVENQKGRWDHEAWEKLVKDVSNSGIEMSDDTRRHLGNMLESVKHFYTELSKPGTKKKAAAKKKSSAKKKSPAKKKAASKPKTAAKKKSASKKKKPAAKKA